MVNACSDVFSDERNTPETTEMLLKYYKKKKKKKKKLLIRLIVKIARYGTDDGLCSVYQKGLK